MFRDAGANITVTGTKPTAGDYDADLSGMTYRQLVLTHVESIALAADFTELDVLVNNASANFPGGLDESQPAGFDASAELLLAGALFAEIGYQQVMGQLAANVPEAASRLSGRIATKIADRVAAGQADKR